MGAGDLAVGGAIRCGGRTEFCGDSGYSGVFFNLSGNYALKAKEHGNRNAGNIRSNMNEEITASYVWTADELIKAKENHWRAQCRPGYRAGLTFLSLMAILAGWGYYHSHGWATFTILYLLFPVAGIYFLFLRKYDARWALCRHFKKRPDRDAHIVVTLGEDTYCIKSEEAESKQKWSQISKVRKARNGFLLYPNDMIYYWLPLTAIASEADRVRTEELLRNKVRDFAIIR